MLSEAEALLGKPNGRDLAWQCGPVRLNTPNAMLEKARMTAIRWIVRGIPIETADAVREVACETGGSLGEILSLPATSGAGGSPAPSGRYGYLQRHLNS